MERIGEAGIFEEVADADAQIAVGRGDRQVEGRVVLSSNGMGPQGRKGKEDPEGLEGMAPSSREEARQTPSDPPGGRVPVRSDERYAGRSSHVCRCR